MHHSLVLFAQHRPQGPPPEFALVVLALGCVGVIVGIITLTLVILHLITVYKTFNLIAKRNRTMEPGMVFLVFVPLLGIVWPFFVVLRLAESLRNEFEDRGWDTEGESFGYGMGLAMAILNLTCGPIGLIFTIIHWRQISGYATRLSRNGRGNRR
jgi:hypothetical protein